MLSCRWKNEKKEIDAIKAIPDLKPQLLGLIKTHLFSDGADIVAGYLDGDIGIVIDEKSSKESPLPSDKNKPRPRRR